MKVNLMHTRNGLPKAVRVEATALLQVRLADSIDLMMQARQARWNVKAADFIGLHELFDKVSTDTGRYVDLIALRIVQLGGAAQGSIRVAALASGLPDFAPEISKGRRHVAELAHAITFYGGLIRQSIVLAAKFGDTATADLLTTISRRTTTNLWFVEAHEQAEHYRHNQATSELTPYPR